METYGSHVVPVEGSGKKKGGNIDANDQEVLVIAPLLGTSTTTSSSSSVVILPALPYASLEALESCQLDTQQCEWKRVGKKEIKITLKFVCTTTHTTTNDVAPLATPFTTDTPLMVVPPSTTSTTTWTFPESTVLYQGVQTREDALQQEKEAAVAEAAAATAAAAAVAAAEDEEMVVTAYDVSGKIDYDKLVQQFGSQIMPPDLLAKLEALTVGKGRVSRLHRFLRRNIFFSHRDLDTLLSCVEKGIPMYLYTGRGPSSSAMHLGHLIPFLFTQWLQKAFGCPLVIQMTDDEKFLFKGEYEDGKGDNLQHYAKLTMENAKDIIACEFNYDKTFIFSDLDYVGVMYPNIVRIWKAVTTNTVNGIFGFDGSSNIGKIAFPAIQAAPSFANSFPTVLQAPDRHTDQLCLIPCAIDQDPYFRMTRDVAHKLVHKDHPLGGKPALIHSKFFPPLQGATGKMSSSNENSAIFLTDTPQQIHDKIMKHAFSGGQEKKEDQQKYGADLELDVSYQWLRFFLEDDDELAAIGESYGTGQGDYWSTSLVKKRLIVLLQELVAAHQERRAKLTDDDVRKWMKERSIL
jgi:tryptophanyl-tRNA synthetase